MFTSEVFDLFELPGLEERMQAIRSSVHPLFQRYAESISDQLEEATGEVFPIHLAQHRRRTTYAPDYTWVAIGGNQRGYKRFPHFQIGITRHYLVFWLSLIDQPDHEEAIGRYLQGQRQALLNLPSDLVLNGDHTKNDYFPLTPANLDRLLDRLIHVKKGEFQIGRLLTKEEVSQMSEEVFKDYVLATYRLLCPVYQGIKQELQVYHK